MGTDATLTVLPTIPHRLEAYITSSIVIEIETPSNRNDITRFRDDHGRVEKGYGWSVSNTLKAEEYGFKSMQDGSLLIREKIKMSNVSFSKEHISSSKERGGLFIALKTYYLRNSQKKLIKEGNVYTLHELSLLTSKIGHDDEFIKGIYVEWINSKS